ncbi:hypothetical protein ACJJTC_017124 [Scirpophaga incertulas]
MCEQTEINYLDGDVVWVKLGSCWWPGEVVGPEKLPPDLLPSFRKPPIAVVKFFQEDTFEYVKNINAIYKYNCSRKNEFINKGLYMFRTKHGPMEKFPEDVIRAETAVGGDIEILTRDEFQEIKKESYAGLFGDTPKKCSSSGKKGKGKTKSSEKTTSTPIRKIKEKTDYKVHILLQGSSSINKSTEEETAATSISKPVDSENEGGKIENISPQIENSSLAQNLVNIEKPVTPTFSTPVSTPGVYSCHACNFSTTRMNVLILHNKTHSITFTPYTPSPIKKKVTKLKITPTTSKLPKPAKPRKEKLEKRIKKSQELKRSSEEKPLLPKKVKTDQEIKSSLLADWDDVDEESYDDSSVITMTNSPDIAVASESPAVPTPTELSAQVPADIPLPVDKKENEPVSVEKSESITDSKYEFCEDEDWPVEKGIGRKIPRVKNPSQKKDDSKSIDDDEVAREVAELLNKTTVPELPSVPEPLKVEENFPERSVAKSPDKPLLNTLETSKQTEKTIPEHKPTKTIFKTKTFFRSRHSRSQDAIGKYVAEQLNAVERMDLSETDINGSDVVSSPEARESPPIEPVKVAKLAPKIQLKKMKAEAQLREKERNEKEIPKDDFSTLLSTPIKESEMQFKPFLGSIESNNTSVLSANIIQDVLYPTQEIKPVNEKNCVGSQGLLGNIDLMSSFIKNDSKKIDEIVNDNVSVENVDINIPTFANTIESKTGCSFKSTLSEAKIENIYDDKEKIADPPFMNETTASAVDALLSVSRETDRVTKVVSDDPPEDLFEDDNGMNPVNGFNDTLNTEVVQANDLHIENHESDEIVLHDKNTEEQEKLIVEDNHIEPAMVPPIIDEIQIQSSLNVEVNNIEEVETETVVDCIPSESDLQIAEALINLPSTTIPAKLNEQLDNISIPMSCNISENVESENVIIDNNTNDPQDVLKLTEIGSNMEQESTDVNENMAVRFETEKEKSENLNAAQSLVQMSESIDHKINIIETSTSTAEKVSKTDSCNGKQNNGMYKTVEQNITSFSCDNNVESSNCISQNLESTPSKLLKILKEPCIPKLTKSTSNQSTFVPGKEKILNFEVAKSSPKGKSQSPVIIRRAAANKALMSSLNDNSSEKIFLSCSSKSLSEMSTGQSYTIQTSPKTVSSDPNTITIFQPKGKKINKPPTKIQKIKPQTSLVQIPDAKKIKDTAVTEDTIFDINSMPIVLSDDILTPENIDKMPIVMSDGNIITNTTNTSNPPKLVKSKSTPSKQVYIDSEKSILNPGLCKPEVKTLLMNPVNDVNKATPNILSKSPKLRGAKPMLVIDKATGKQKIIMTKSETAVKEFKPSQTLIHPINQNSGKAEKFILLPSSTPRQSRTQKIVIDPQSGKAHVLVAKGPESSVNENRPVSAKLIPSSSDASGSGSTVMIITNAQGGQSRIVLTSEHEKLLFPNKPQNSSQLKTITHKIVTNSGSIQSQKTVVNSVPQIKSNTRIASKQKSAIITSKGQLIVGGCVATTVQNINPMPEMRPVPKRIVSSEPKKIVQTVQKTTPSEPIIFLQQKSGLIQLTTSQFEHFQRTGQIIQRIPAPSENRPIIQKTITISPSETPPTIVQKRIRKTVMESPAPSKRFKQEIVIAPAPTIVATPVPALTPLSSNIATTLGPSISNTVSVTTTSSYADLDNLEEMLPSTAIVRQPESVSITLQSDPVPMVRHTEPAPMIRQTEPVPPTPPEPAPPAALADGQLLAVPGEHFGGPPGSFYLCVEDNGTLTPIDNRPLVLENNQLVPMAETLPVITQQPERRDILEAALANSDVFHAEPARDEAPDFRDLNANVSVHCRVSETSTTLNQPIMTPVEMPTKVDSEPTMPTNLEDGLAVIGVTPHTVPTSLELPITVTDPRIAPKIADPLSGTNYGRTLLSSPNTEMSYVGEDVEAVGPISMPLLTDEQAVGKSMPMLTDDAPSHVLPSDNSDNSSEIPLQPAIQLSINDISQHS